MNMSSSWVMRATCFQSKCCISFTIPGAMLLSEATGRKKVGNCFTLDNRGDVEVMDTWMKTYTSCKWCNGTELYLSHLYTRFQNGAKPAIGWEATEQSGPIIRISISLLLVTCSMNPRTACVSVHWRWKGRNECTVFMSVLHSDICFLPNTIYPLAYMWSLVKSLCMAFLHLFLASPCEWNQGRNPSCTIRRSGCAFC